MGSPLDLSQMVTDLNATPADLLKFQRKKGDKAPKIRELEPSFERLPWEAMPTKDEKPTARELRSKIGK